MAKAPWTDEALYAAAQRFVDACLRTDGSLFTPGEAVWTAETANEAAQRLLVDDTRKLDYMTKLKDQVGDLSANAIQLTAELLYVQLLPIADTGGETKRKIVRTILGWMAQPVALPEDLSQALDFGVAHYGAGMAQRDRYVKFLGRFVVAWKETSSEHRMAALSDPWAFRQFVYDEVGGPALMQREALLHLVFPEVFEHALAPDDKRKIVRAFDSLPEVAGADNADHAMLAIREVVQPVLGERFSHYDPPFRPLWAEGSTPEWDGLTRWASQLYELPEFEKAERDYKLEIAKRLTAARTALGAEGDWLSALKPGLGGKNNLTPWQTNDSFVKWCEHEPDAAKLLLKRLWDSDEPDIEGFLEELPEEAVATDGARIAITSLLLSAVDATAYPVFRPTPFDRASSLLGRETAGLRSAARYGAFISLLDELRLRLLTGGVSLRDRLDAQSLLWWVMSGEPPDSWSEEERSSFLAFRERRSRTGPGGEGKWPYPERAWLVRGANVDGTNLVPEWLEEGYVSVGWHEVGDLQAGISRNALAERVREIYPDEAPGAQRAAVGNLNRFVNVVQPGHLVLTADRDTLYVGRVTGDPSFDGANADGSARRRTVEWLNLSKPASRSEVRDSYPGLYSRLRTLLTVTDLTEDVDAVAALAGLTDKPVAPSEPLLPDVTDEVAESLFIPRQWLQQEIIDLLREQRQLIFFGPPGTGKTYVAQAIAEHITSTGGEFELIQFHPSYGYEDFFEGFRPAPSEDGAGVLYELTPGPLRRVTKAASEDPARPYVLIIDEINRGNIPKIFGELLFLLEYRDAKVPLQYSPEAQFGLPKNLYVIGTMNTADRSIALVDAALRRRFYFVPFMPREAPISGVLAEWLEANGHDGEPADLLKALNDRIANDEIAIGPSYFMTGDGSYPNLERVWRHAIMPLLEEHYYGTGRDVRGEFGLQNLRKSLAAPADVTPVAEVDEQELTAAE